MAEEKVKDSQIEEEIDGTEETEGSENQGKEGDTGGNKANNAGGNAGDKQGKTFTQEQVNRMMAREKNQGRAAALKELGIDPKDTKSMAMVKALIESQKTDDQKAAEKAAAENEKQLEAERRATIAEIKAEAMMLNAQPQFVDDIVALVMSKMDDDTDVKSIVGEYKTKYPAWFKVEDDDKGGKGKAGQRGTGSSVKGNANDKGGSETKGLGARLAAQRKSNTSKSSFWGSTKR